MLDACVFFFLEILTFMHKGAKIPKKWGIQYNFAVIIIFGKNCILWHFNFAVGSKWISLHFNFAVDTKMPFQNFRNSSKCLKLIPFLGLLR